jgi:hypothetical protein
MRLMTVFSEPNRFFCSSDHKTGGNDALATTDAATAGVAAAAVVVVLVTAGDDAIVLSLIKLLTFVYHRPRPSVHHV